MKLNIQSETHCDHCNEIIHNHFDCPVCKEIRASTSVYGYISDHMSYSDTLDCEECGAKFKLVSGECWDPEAEWEQVI